MTRPTFDVAVVGLGAAGSAALYHLARGGYRVVGLEQFTSPHDQGSSHGGSRIIREAYFEGSFYVPLVQRAYQLWAELEHDAQEKLLIETGGVMIGPPGSALVDGALRSAREHGLRHELLSASEVTRRFPALLPAPEMSGVWEPRAGVLLPERCVAAHLDLAASAGADVRMNTRVARWRPTADGIALTTSSGEVDAGQVVLAAGAWLPGLVDLDLRLSVERVVQAWFAPARDLELLAPERCPITIWQYAPDRTFYAFPALDGEVKAALHHQGEVADPAGVRREVADSEIERVLEPLRRHIPAAAGRPSRAKTCMYSNTPDEDFVIDRHPDEPRAIVVSACSGHGFKFASAIGEAVAGMVGGAAGPVPERFGLARFAPPARAKKLL
jgi:sarcosine oxidase